MNTIANICDKLVKVCLSLVVFVLPAFFLPWTFETLDFNKQNLLIILTLLAGLAWLGKMVASRQVVLRRSFLNVLILLYVSIYTLATIFSFDRIRSFLGASGLEKEGLITVLCFVILYFVIINNFRDMKAVKNLLYSYLLGAGLVTVWTVFTFLGALPAQLVPGRALNSVGTLNSLGIFLGAAFVLLCPLFLGEGEEKKKVSKSGLILKIVMAVVAVLMLFILATIDNWIIWTIFVPVIAFFLAFIIIRAHEVKNLGWLALPMAAFVIAILLFFINTPIVSHLPAEIMPSFSSSSSIARQTLQEAPLLGSGPSTFVFDYAKYKPVDINETQLWDIKFDRSSSRFLTMLTTTGLFGVISWLFMAVFLAVLLISNLIKEKSGELWLKQLAVGAAWIALLLGKFLYSSNLTLELSFWILTAMLVVMTSHRFWEISLGNAPRVSLLLSFFLAIGLILAVSSFYLVGERYVADTKFVQAIDSLNKGEDLSKATDLLNQAASLNQRNDVYLRNLAQSLQAQINQELSITPTEEGAQKIQELITADINVAKRATEISPKNSANWATLASIYQTIMSIISGADEWALNSWQKAIELEPSNPYLYTELGGTYAMMADLLAPSLQSKDDKVKSEAEKKIKENLYKAEEQFNKAITNKSDYAPAHFELALVYSRQGKIDEAIGKLESVRLALPNDIGVAFQLGLLYAQDKELDKAITELERAVNLAPSFANARWYLAAFYEEQGKKDLAISQLEEILKTNPDNEIVKQKIDSLKKSSAGESAVLPNPISEAIPAQ